MTIVSTTIARVRVKDVMYSEVASVKSEIVLLDTLETIFTARYHDNWARRLLPRNCDFDIMKVASEANWG